VFTIVLSLVLVLLGLLGFSQLTVRFQPYYFRPHLVITTLYPGASSDAVESNLTAPLERALNATVGLSQISSRSFAGQSFIYMDFDSLNQQQFVIAQSQVLQEIASAKLPQSVQQPKIYQSSGSKWSFLVALTDPNMNRSDLNNFINNVLAPRLATVPGIGAINYWTGTSTLLISLDPAKMAALGLTPLQVTQAIENNNQNVPVGQVVTAEQAIQINANLTLSNINDFKNLVIKNSQGRLVTLQDIAQVTVVPSRMQGSFAQVNGENADALLISAADDANPIQLCEDLTATLKIMAQSFSPGMQYHILFNIGEPLKAAINEVYQAIGIAIILVVLISLFFLGSIRATLIPMITIPICLIATFAIMLVLGFTINVMTLLAFVLGVGLVVDDAIVVLENSMRHIEAGLKPFDAAYKSIKEISFAVLGMTLCLVAIYIPLVFIPRSFVATFFQEFSFTLAGAVLFSGFVALTLTPMMCAHILKIHKDSVYQQKLVRLIQKLQTAYQKYLDWVLTHRRYVLIVFAGFILLTGIMYKVLPTDQLPKNELDYIFGELTGPSATNNQFMEQQMQGFLQQVKTKFPEVQNSIIGTDDQGAVFVFFQLSPSTKRHLSNDALARQLNALIGQYPNLEGGLSVMNINQMSGPIHQGGLYFYVTGMASYREITNAAQNMANALNHYPGVTMAYNNAQFNTQTINLSINRDYATSLGVAVTDINEALSTLFGGYTATTEYQVGGYGYPIIVQLPFKDLNSFAILNTTYVKSSNGSLIPLASLVSAQTALDLPYRMHMNLLRAGEIDVNIAQAYTSGQVINKINQLAKQLPGNLRIYFGGNVGNYYQDTETMSVVFILGLVFIYLVLAALFESFIDPLIVLVAVPPCILGALFALWLMRGSLNVYTSISLVTLIGLVAKHGILITQFSNQLRMQGMTLNAAVKQAATIRLRPILMTSLTMIFGALPLVFATGTDAFGRQQIGMVIVFGLIVGTFFSLFIVPVAYTLLAGFKNKTTTRN
jgi:hydrophobe/amphiphile efflux-1 (HAE1) family protein